MALQTDRLSMLGLGVDPDAPPPGSLQPGQLTKGVHLRWATQRELGFPWHGFYLFRRPHRKTVPVCLSTDIASKPTGPLNAPTLKAAVGTVSSDATLVLTQLSGGPTARELDLDGRSYVHVDRPPDEPAYGVDVTIGFRQTVGGRNPATHIDFAGVKSPPATSPAPPAGPATVSPLIWKGAVFQVFGPHGPENPKVRSWPTVGVGSALVCGRRLRVFLPCSATSVAVTTVGGLARTIVALDAGGKDVRTATAASPTSPIITTNLAYDGIAGIEIRTDAPEDVAIGLVKLSFTCRPRPPIEVTAYSGTSAVATQALDGAAGTTGKVAFRFDRITSVRVTSGSASLIELCFLPVLDGARTGWKPLPRSPNPICLPVGHADYPCNPKPVTLATSRKLALRRIRYDAAGPWAAAFTDLHAQLKQLVVGGPPQPMATRTTSFVGVAEPADATTDQLPTLPNLSPLDLVLLGALHPTIAQMIGLYWVDETAVLGTAYDYLVVADHEGKSKRGSAAILAEIGKNGFANLDGFIAFGLVRGAPTPLAAPQDVRAYALPDTTVGMQDGTLEDSTLAAGLRWSRDTTTTVALLPDKPFLFHVWRSEQLGNGNSPLEPTSYAALTVGSPVLIGDSPAGATPPVQQGTPQFRLFHFDRGLDEGWYAYRVSGIDIFGRHSAQSPPARWLAWTPAESLQNPKAVRLLDKVPPPIPTGVEAYALDPDDPMLLRDAKYDKWFATLSAAEKTSLVGLRVRWKWTWAHMRQAPDTAEFRIYFNPGSAPPPYASEAVQWATRYYVVPYADPDHMTITTEDGLPLRQYEVIIPVQGDAVRASVPLVPSLVHPVVYANVGVTAADGRSTADAPKWAAGTWGGRQGNEGRVGPAATIYRVWRTKPPAPAVPPADSDRVYASPADYHSHSFYTYRWLPSTNLRTHVFRALDESVFAADWAQRPRASLTSSDLSAFPSEADETRWDAAKRQQVAAELNELNDAAGRDAALILYRKLSNDGLRVLAGLPGNDAAFSQLTIEPLDPAENADRRGPDNPATYVPSASLRSFLDTLDGRTTSRYFYRAAYVDGAHNLGPLSLSGPPVYLPNVVPPQPPKPTRVVLGDGSATVSWASNREPDLDEYRVYRTSAEDDARDLRLMELVRTIAVAAGDPATRPAEVSWEDATLVGGNRYWFRLTAVDDAANESPASAPIAVQAVDTRPPAAPVWVDATWVLLEEDGTEEPWPTGAIPNDRTPALRLAWESDLVGASFTITRRGRGDQLWRPVAGAGYRSVSSTQYRLYDTDVTPDVTYAYRAIATSKAGVASLVPRELAVARP